MRTKKSFFVSCIAIICALLMAVGMFAGCYAECKHTAFKDGKCTECGYPCRHNTYKDGKCTVCGTECTHGRYEDGVCVNCGEVCGHEEYADGECTVCGTPCAHPDYADGECVTCGYACTHEDYTADGYCEVCGKECEHIYLDGECVNCGKEKPEPEKPKPVEPEPDYSYAPHLDETLPKIYLTSEDPEFMNDANNDRDWFDNENPANNIDWQYHNCTVTVTECDDAYALSDIVAQVKVRGNWTTTYPKKPFRIKFDKKQAMLGLNGGKKMKSWVLLADYKDFTLERNSVALYLGNQIMGSDGYYCTDFRQVEVYLNNSYWGVYLLAEQQQVNENRINVTEPDEKNDPLNPYIGYFLEYDGYYNLEVYNERFSCNYNVDDQTAELNQWNSSPLKAKNGSTVYPNQFGFSIKNDVYENEEYPESDARRCPQKTFIKNYIYNVYKLCYNAVYRDTYYQFNDEFTALVPYKTKTTNPVKETVSKAIDLQSLVDMYIHCEIVCDYDLGWSSFLMDVDLAPDKDHRLRFEAPWDFDSSLGLRYACDSGKGLYAANTNNPWLLIFVNEDWYQDMISAKWTQLKQAGVQQSALQLLNTMKDNYSEAYKRNFDRWGWQINGEATEDIRNNVHNHSDGVAHLCNWLETRFKYLDSVWL